MLDFQKEKRNKWCFNCWWVVTRAATLLHFSPYISFLSKFFSYLYGFPTVSLYVSLASFPPIILRCLFLGLPLFFHYQCLHRFIVIAIFSCLVICHNYVFMTLLGQNIIKILTFLIFFSSMLCLFHHIHFSLITDSI